LRQEKVGMEYSASDEGQKLQMTPCEGVYMSADGKGSSKSAVKSSSNLVKRMKTRPRMHRPAAVRGSPYRHSYWRRYRQSQLRSYKRTGGRERREEAGAADSDVIDAPRDSGVHWELVGPISAAMQTSICSVCFSEKVKKCGTEGCRYGRER